jgi:predicted phage terminase large subunit-like protein
MENVTLPVNEVRESCKVSYAFFCNLMQEDGWFDPVHERLCNFVQGHIEAALFAGTDAKIQITMPRGSLKTTIITKYLPIWLTLRDTEMRSLIATNTHTNARKKLNDVRGLFDTNQLFRTLFPELLPNKNCRWTEECAEVNRQKSFPEGTFECCGVKTKMEGRHYNLIVEDDTVAPDESDIKEDITMPSQEDIASAIGWHKKSTALMPPKGTRIRVIVTTRWAEEDLVHHVRTNETGYKFFDMPALDSNGEPNFSMFYSKEKLEEIKSQIGIYMFSCMYLNQPLDPSQRAFRGETFHWVKPHEVPTGGKITIAIDPAISEKSDACDTAITAVKHFRKDGVVPYQYWLRVIAKRMSPHETIAKAMDLAEELGAHSIIVETVAYQKALKFGLRDEMAIRGSRFPLVEFQSRNKKEVRIYGLEPLFENGRILFVEGLDRRVKEQLLAFPHGKLVDIIDSFSMHMKGYSSQKVLIEDTPGEVTDENSLKAILQENRAKYARTNPEVSSFMFDSALETGLPTFNAYSALSSFRRARPTL